MESKTLLSAQIHFLDTELALIHVPLHLYNYFLQPILQLLLPTASSSSLTTAEPTTGAEHIRSRRPWAYNFPFVNISLTSIECSVVCSRTLANQLFQPLIRHLDQQQATQVSISEDSFIVMQVDGEGLDAGRRVLDLTGPLAMSGISIFFITTYFSDYILVPLQSRSSVISALEARGFQFSTTSEAFVNVSSPLLHPLSMPMDSNATSSGYKGEKATYFDMAPNQLANQDSSIPPTPPPSSVKELEIRTFNTLKKYCIRPSVNAATQLVQCAGRKDTLHSNSGEAHSSAIKAALRLHVGIVKCLISTPRPEFLSITLTDTEPLSLLMEKTLLANFEDSSSKSDEVLLGSKEDLLVPITLDLRNLPARSPGIICGVAGKLAGSTNTPPRPRIWGSCGSAVHVIGPSSDSVSEAVQLANTVEMSYLSTARAGNVIVAQTELEQALMALNQV